MAEKQSNNEESFKEMVSLFGELPPQVMQQVCMHVTTENVFRIWRHIPLWGNLINDEYFWEMKCKQNGYFPIEEALKSPVHKRFSDALPLWQGIYLYNHNLNYNWKNNIFQEIPLGRGGLLQEVHYFDDEMVVVTTLNRIIRIYNSLSGKLEKCFKIVKGAGRVLTISKHDNVLICITQYQAKIWNIVDESILNTWIWAIKITYIHRFSIDKNLIAIEASYPLIYRDINRNSLLILLNREDLTAYYNGSHDFRDMSIYNTTVVYLHFKTLTFLKIHDNYSTTTLNCYSNNHAVAKIFVKREYVIGLCNSLENTCGHLSIWNIETSRLVRFIPLEFADQVFNSDYDRFDVNFYLLEQDKLAIMQHHDPNSTSVTVKILNYLTGENVLNFSVPISLTNLKYCEFGIKTKLKTWNNHVLVITREDVDLRSIRIFCSTTGTHLRTIKIDCNSSTVILRDIIFTATKMLKIVQGAASKSISKKYISILDFEKPLKIPN